MKDLRPAAHETESKASAEQRLLVHVILAVLSRVDFLSHATFSCVSSMFDMRQKVTRAKKLSKVYPPTMSYHYCSGDSSRVQQALTSVSLYRSLHLLVNINQCTISNACGIGQRCVNYPGIHRCYCNSPRQILSSNGQCSGENITRLYYNEHLYHIRTYMLCIVFISSHISVK